MSSKGDDQPRLISSELKTDDEIAQAIREHYTKYEFRIPMRDGVRLFTHVYAPKEHARAFPILMKRTPYGIGPYGIDNYPIGHGVQSFAPSTELIREGFIFVHQDVRGKLMSEGAFVDIRPFNAQKKRGASAVGAHEVDESSDAYDTIDWLVRNLPNNNGNVGVWGISYPGFYAAQASIDAHPALKAVSPQAPVTDWFAGDDFHHNGALFLADAFLFYADFGKERPKPTPVMKWEFDPRSGDIYDFFLRLGPLTNANTEFFDNKIAFWNEVMAHGTLDEFWKARNPRPHLKNIKPAVMTVGGWFDAEDIFGTLATYRSIEKQSPGAESTLVMGPWRHGGWARSDGDSLGEMRFGAKTSLFYREKIEAPFFLRHLKGRPLPRLPEAWVFETGTNEWRIYDAWPPRDATPATIWFGAGGTLTGDPPAAVGGDSGADTYVSDPQKPVPYRDQHSNERVAEYMVEDQRFAARRPDVLVYNTTELAEDVTLSGPISAALWVSTTGTDADFVVKVVDVYPENATDPDPNPKGVRMGGYQALVRAEVMRGKFRNAFDRPEPFVSGQPTKVEFSLPDVQHTFRAGHRIMVQIQSSWFPLVDRNPQVFTDIYRAKASDFRAATHGVYRSGEHASGLKVLVERGHLPHEPPRGPAR